MKGKYFKVLDHGFVGLVDYMGDDQAIEQAARVSYGPGTRKTSDTRSLLRYLMRNEHVSPFEMCEVVFHVQLPIFVARQIVRSRTCSINEVSGRYSELPTIYYTPTKYRKQSTTNKQGSGENVEECMDLAVKYYSKGLREDISDHYKYCLEHEVSRELARIDLPLSTYTSWIWKMDLRNLFHFLKLRLDSHAQWEIRQFARIKAAFVKKLFPIAWEAFVDYQLSGVYFSRQEHKLLLDILSNQVDLNRTDIGYLINDYKLSKREWDEFKVKIYKYREVEDIPNLDNLQPLEMEGIQNA